MPEDPLLYLALMAVLLGGGVWLGWTLGARGPRERRKPTALPLEIWLCERCRSFNEPERELCYRCHRERPADAPSFEPNRTFRIEQRFGMTFGDPGMRGPSRPWLAADEPLLDRWLAGHPGPPAVNPAPETEAPSPEPPDEGGRSVS
jgi:hypothetical protein